MDPARAERQAEFERLRGEGGTFEEACAAVGISPRTGRAYETERRRAARTARTTDETTSEENP